MYAHSPRTSIPNIRIVKYLSTGRLTFVNLMFYVTVDADEFRLIAPNMLLRYCPFCGVKLTDYYRSDKYANEIEGETFNQK